MDETFRTEASARIEARALELPRIQSARRICSYVGFGSEVATEGLIARLIESKGSVVVPRVVRDEPIVALHRVTDFPRGFRRGVYKILEPDPEVWTETVHPTDLEVIFVPGVGFDRRGGRIGFGAGYYDRLLAMAPSLYKIALCFSFQIVDDLPTDDRDVGMDAILTEKEFLEFP